MSDSLRTQFDELIKNVKAAKDENNQRETQPIRRIEYSFVNVTNQIDKPNEFANARFYALSAQDGIWSRILAAYMPCTVITDLFSSANDSSWSYNDNGLKFDTDTLSHQTLEIKFTSFTVNVSENDPRKGSLICTCSARCTHCNKINNDIINTFDFVLLSLDPDETISDELIEDIQFTLAMELSDKKYTLTNALYLPSKATRNCRIESHIMIDNDTLERCNADSVIFALHKSGINDILILNIHESKPNSNLRIL